MLSIEIKCKVTTSYWSYQGFGQLSGGITSEECTFLSVYINEAESMPLWNAITTVKQREIQYPHNMQSLTKCRNCAEIKSNHSPLPYWGRHSSVSSDLQTEY